ncbi:formation of crista junctions protein 1 [Suhomyces tanzawaensis NRRL Y-17324]|uniref:MICOS complex subunit MIC60 n=1 Tax=Suhomyces tanzawaensis NRRL Y-17324 TaxID=984487 RepID=A0A1E4SEJ0_9ASCO|nr:formation of crista junctions protein 1 [Suhomyces tanzawaensis NRRL Y-17324]ODV77908.1 formation of crista junctions protein 1 [Suhomyces tanzawaensis NRRL Y-17324]
MIKAASTRATAPLQRASTRAVRGIKHTPRAFNQPKPVVEVPVVKAPTPPPIKATIDTPPPPKTSWTKFLFRTTLITSILYVGTLYAATKNDDLMDFVIDKNPPYYEEILDLIENGSVDDLKKKLEGLQSKISNLELPSKDKIDQITHKLEKSGEDLIKETKEKIASTAEGVSFNSRDATPAQQLQKPVEIESVKKDIKQLPLIQLGSDVVDDSVKSTVAAFNNLIKSIDASKIAGGSNSNLIATINQSVAQLSNKLKALTKDFDDEVQSKLKVSQTELLSSYTKKELELTENMLHQYNTEKTKLEQKLNNRLTQEIQATKEAISQAAVNAVSMVRIEQTKNFEKLIKDKIDEERDGRLANFDKLSNRLTELESFAESLESQLVANHQKSLINQSLTKLKSVLFTSDETAKPQLVKPYVDNLAKISQDSKDEVIELALKDLQKLLEKESTQSILTTSQLLGRWELLVPELRSASLLPPNAGLLGHLTSALFSKFLFPVKGNRPDGKDIESVIGRVEASLVRGELDVAVEEVTNLKGWSRKLADDWVIEGRKRLEAEFLIGLIEAEAKVL